MARIFNKTNNTIGKDINKFSSTYLKTAIKQLQKKKKLIHQIDLYIKKLIQMSEELEDEAKELQDSIIEKISELQMHIELKTLELTSKSLPNNTEGVASSFALEPKNTDASQQGSRTKILSIGTICITSSWLQPIPLL